MLFGITGEGGLIVDVIENKLVLQLEGAICHELIELDHPYSIVIEQFDGIVEEFVGKKFGCGLDQLHHAAIGRIDVACVQKYLIRPVFIISPA